MQRFKPFFAGFIITAQNQHHLKHGVDATVDYEKNTVTNELGSIELTKNEIFILKELIEQKNKIVSRESINQKLMG